MTLASHLLTTSDRAAMRHDSRADDADARLATIQRARDELESAVFAAVEKFTQVANDMREHGKPVSAKEDEETVKAMLQIADDTVWRIVSDLEEMANGEGRYAEEG